MDAHPIQQPINEIDIYTDADGDLCSFKVGRNGVTSIEACTKPGLHCDIPYVRVWRDAECLGEFCQHNIVGVYFEQIGAPLGDVTERARCKALGIRNIEDGICTTCEKSEAECDCIPF